MLKSESNYIITYSHAVLQNTAFFIPTKFAAVHLLTVTGLTIKTGMVLVVFLWM